MIDLRSKWEALGGVVAAGPPEPPQAAVEEPSPELTAFSPPTAEEAPPTLEEKWAQLERKYHPQTDALRGQSLGLMDELVQHERAAVRVLPELASGLAQGSAVLGTRLRKFFDSGYVRTPEEHPLYKLGNELQDWTETYFPRDAREGYGTKVTGAVAQALTLAGTGGTAGAALNAPRVAAFAGLSGLVGGIGDYKTVRMAGGTEEDAWKAARIGGLFSAITEPLPLEFMLGKSAGPAAKLLARWLPDLDVTRGFGKAAALATKGSLSAALNAVQELGDQAKTNALQNRYSPTQVAWSLGLWEAGKLGFLTGLFVDTAISALQQGGPEYQRLVAEEAARIDAETAATGEYPDLDALEQSAPTGTAPAPVPGTEAAPQIPTSEGTGPVSEAGPEMVAEGAVAEAPAQAPVEEGPRPAGVRGRQLESLEEAPEEFRAGVAKAFGEDAEVVRPVGRIRETITRFLTGRGFDVVFVRRKDGQPGLAYGATSRSGNVIAFDDTLSAGKLLRDTVLHEVWHGVGSRSPAAWVDWIGRVQRVDPEGWAAVRAGVLANPTRSDLVAAGAIDKLSETGVTDETASEYVEAIGDWIEGALTNDKTLLNIANNDRGLFIRLLDGLVETLNKLGLNLELPSARRVERMAEKYGKRPGRLTPRDAAQLALDVKNTINALQSIQEEAAPAEGAGATRFAPREQKDPGAMTPSQVNAELAALRKADSDLTDRMIAAGRGGDRASDTRAKAAQGDALGMEYVKIQDRLYALRQEIARRVGPGFTEMPRGAARRITPGGETRFKPAERRAGERRKPVAEMRFDEEALAPAVEEQRKKERRQAERAKIAETVVFEPEEAASEEQARGFMQERRTGERRKRAEEPAGMSFEQAQKEIEATRAELESDTGTRFSVAPRTDSPAFKEWFGEGQTVSEGRGFGALASSPGKPLALYHGSPAGDITSFRGSSGGAAGPGVYLALHPRKAELFAGPTGAVYPVYARGNYYRVLVSRFADPGKDSVLAEAAAKGADGILIDGAGEVLVFDPVNIKSATGNVGTYSRESADIRFAVAKEDPEEYAQAVGPFSEGGFAQPTEGVLASVDKWVFDVMQKVKARVKAVERGGGTITDANDTYLVETLWRGKAMERIKRFRSRYMDPIRKAQKRGGLSGKDVGEFLEARHAPERNAQVRKLYQEGEGPESPSGMSDADAQAILAKWADNAEMQRIGRIWDHMNRAKVRGMVADGLIDQETADRLLQYKHWAPLRTLTEDEHALMGLGRSHEIRDAGLKRAFGRATRADNPLLSGFTSYAMAVTRGEHARVGQAALQAERDNPDPDNATINEPIYKMVVDKKTGFARNVYDVTALQDPNVLSVMDKGRRVYIRYNKKRQAYVDALKGSPPSVGADIVNGFNKISRDYTALLTRRNPFFLPVNGLRDIISASIISLGEKGVVLNPLRLPQAWRALHSGKGKYAEYAREYKDVGAPIASLGLDDLQKTVERLAKTANGSGPIVERLKAVDEAISEANDVVENGTRFLAYVKLREMGYTPARAGFYAKELINFERKGVLGPALNAHTILASAGLAGIRTTARAMKSPRTQALMVATVGAAALLDVISRALAGDDEDGLNRYDKLPDWEKANNLILHYGKDYISVPLPPLFRIFWHAGNQVGAVLDGGKAPWDAAAAVTDTAIQDLSILGSGFAQIISPWFLDPLADVVSNRDWKGAPINPTKFDRNLPDSANYFPGTPDWAKSAARALNRLTGGTEAEPGRLKFLDISPGTLERWAQLFTPGVIGEGKRLAEGVASGNLERHQIPLVRRFWKSGDNPFNDLRIVRENMQKIDSVKKRAEARKKAGLNPPEDNALNSQGWRARANRTQERIQHHLDLMRQAKTQEEANMHEAEMVKAAREFNGAVRKALDK